MQVKLRCKVSRGQFSNECAVEVESYGGNRFSLFTDRSDVSFEGSGLTADWIDGWLNVDIVNQRDGYFVVRLPQTTLESGQYLSVSAGQFDHFPYPQIA